MNIWDFMTKLFESVNVHEKNRPTFMMITKQSEKMNLESILMSYRMSKGSKYIKDSTVYVDTNGNLFKKFGNSSSSTVVVFDDKLKPHIYTDAEQRGIHWSTVEGLLELSKLLNIRLIG